MLRVSTLYASSAAATAAYYARYLAEAPGEEPGVWWGQQADEFGLVGAVSEDALATLLSGRDPITGSPLGRELIDWVKRDGTVVRAVAGFDATFSAPKSLSVWWALTGDDRLLEAHDAAVAATLEHVERFGSTTRIRTDGRRVHPDTGGLTVAVFRQSTSRDDDPQVHTHAVISAKVQTDDGRWYALDARYLKRQQRMLGGLYQSLLRCELTDRFGVGWAEIVNGQAEIAGVPRDLLAVFSKRSVEIDEALADKVAEFVDREVTYPEVWPGVDVVYVPTPAGVEELLMVKKREVPAELGFDVTGAQPGARTAEGGVRLPGTDVSVGGLVTVGADGRGVEPGTGPRLMPTAEGLSVRVDPGWLARLPEAAFPVMIDPTITIESENRRCFARPRGEAAALQPCVNGANVGNVILSANDWQVWRSGVKFEYADQMDPGAVVTNAYIRMSWVDWPGNDLRVPIYVHAGAGLLNDMTWTSFESPALTTVSLGSPVQPPRNVNATVTNQMATWFEEGRTARYFFFGGDQPAAATNTFKKFTHALILTTNMPPPAPTPSTPANGATQHSQTVTLSVGDVTDPENDSVQYRFVGSSTSGCGADRFDSGWINQRQFIWTSPVSLDNQATYWCAQTRDAHHPAKTQTAPARWFKIVNSHASVTLRSPDDDSLRISDTPELVADVGGDPNGDAFSYRFVMSPADGYGLQAASAWFGGPKQSAKWAVPAGLLDANTTYQWGVEVKDRSSAMSTWWTLRVDPGLGLATSSPMQAAGPVSVNLATGNLVYSTASPTVQTVSGPVGVGYTYNSLDHTNQGLRANYYADADSDNVFDANETVYLARRDALPSFNWGTKSPSPSVPVDNFAAQWNGHLTVPATGSWQLRVTHDEAVKVRIGTTHVLDSTVNGTHDTTPITLNAGQAYPIRINYRETTGTATVTMTAIRDANLSYALEPAWFTMESNPLPVGWILTGLAAAEVDYVRAKVSDSGVLLTGGDGSQEFFKETAGGAYEPPDGLDDVVFVNPSTGVLTVMTASGVEQQFNAKGAMIVARTISDDRNPASPEYTFGNAADGSPRVRSVIDPGRGGTTTLTLDYQGGPGTCPPSSTAPGGMLCRISFIGGSTTELRYDTSGRLVTILDPGGERTDIGYDAQGRVTTLRDPLVNDWLASPVYDGSTASQFVTAITYAGGKVIEVTEPSPAAGAPRAGVNLSYGASSTSVTRAGLTGGPHRIAAFNAEGRVTTDTDSVGRVSTLAYDDLGRIIATDSGGRRQTNIFNTSGQLTDAYGSALISCFAANGHPNGTCPVPHTHTDYDQGITGLAFTYWPNITWSGPPTGHATQATSGLADSWVAAPAPGLPGDNFSYQASGLITVPATANWEFKVTADKPATLFIDDAPVATSPNSGVLNNLSAGVHRIRVQGSHTTGTASLTVQWRPVGMTLVTIPGTALSPNYGLPTRETVFDSGDAAPNSVTATRYTDDGWDPMYGLATATVQDPDGLAHTERYTYETPGTGLLRRTSRTKAGGNSYTYEHYQVGATASACGTTANQSSLLAKRTGPAPTLLADEKVYDTLGRMLAVRTGTDPWTCTTYDQRGRVTQVAIPQINDAPARTITTTHNVDGDPRISAVTDAAGTIITTTDLLGRIVEYEDVWGTRSSTGYDQAGRATRATGPAGEIRSTFDNEDRLDTITIDGDTVVDVTYRPDSASIDPGRPERYDYANGTTGIVGYDTYGRPVSMRFEQAGGMLLTQDTLTLSLSGRVLTSTLDSDPTPSFTYTYDTVRRLVRAQSGGIAGDHDFAYCYDQIIAELCDSTDVSSSVGQYNSGRNTNRTTWKDNGAVLARYSYDADDRLTAVTNTQPGSTSSPYDGAPIAYDEHGNTTAVAGELLGYDQSDRHQSVSNGDTTITYRRDALDGIIERSGPDGVKRYSYTTTGDATLDIESNLVEALVPLPGGVLYTRRPTASDDIWSYPNIHGDFIAIANHLGIKVGDTLAYDPYGNSENLFDNRTGGLDQSWLGQQQVALESNTGTQPWTQMGARPYNSVLGRFLTVDPIEGGCANDYVYVAGDPINSSDPTGEAICPYGYILGKRRWRFYLHGAAGAIAYITIPDIYARKGVRVAARAMLAPALIMSASLSTRRKSWGVGRRYSSAVFSGYISACVGDPTGICNSPRTLTISSALHPAIWDSTLPAYRWFEFKVFIHWHVCRRDPNFMGPLPTARQLTAYGWYKVPGRRWAVWAAW